MSEEKKEKKVKKKIGKIRVAQKTRTSAYPKKDGYEVLPIWSRGKKPWKELSPFYLGPVEDEDTGLTAKNMENW